MEKKIAVFHLLTINYDNWFFQVWIVKHVLWHSSLIYAT